LRNVTHDPLACADLIAHRRYAYGQAAVQDGDWAAAAEIFEQTAELAPGWAPAWFALGEARERLGDIEGAAEAFRATLKADHSDALGAAPRLALIGRADEPSALPEAYVARLFDDYAPRFDAHLTKALDYRAPALIAEALDLAAPGRRFASALDIGCGTGLMGEAVRERVDHLTGVDLSPGMIARARERGLYDALDVADATAFLADSAPGAYDCILAADAFCYIGDLRPVLSAATRALAKTGLIAFSVETFERDGFRLQRTMRFAHSRASLEAAAAEAKLRPRLMCAAPTRREAGVDVPGLIAVCFKKRPASGLRTGLALARRGPRTAAVRPSFGQYQIVISR
jgi:predicted TPR repeat methyltransferase